MPNYPIRPAARSDAEQVAVVHGNSVRAAYQTVQAASHSVNLERRRALWLEAIEFGEPLVHVALEMERVVGFVGFDRSRDPKSKSTTGEIWAMYVEPEHWSRGVGRALWDAVYAGLLEEGFGDVTVWIPLCNERALRFFERVGFKRELDTVRLATIAGAKLEEIRLRRNLG